MPEPRCYLTARAGQKGVRATVTTGVRAVYTLQVKELWETVAAPAKAPVLVVSGELDRIRGQVHPKALSGAARRRTARRHAVGGAAAAGGRAGPAGLVPRAHGRAGALRREGGNLLVQSCCTPLAWLRTACRSGIIAVPPRPPQLSAPPRARRAARRPCSSAYRRSSWSRRGQPTCSLSPALGSPHLQGCP